MQFSTYYETGESKKNYVEDNVQTDQNLKTTITTKTSIDIPVGSSQFWKPNKGHTRHSTKRIQL